MDITVYSKNVYGRPLIYPANDAAHALAAIAGVKTLSERELNLARELGHTVTFVLDPAGVAAMRGAA